MKKSDWRINALELESWPDRRRSKGCFLGTTTLASSLVPGVYIVIMRLSVWFRTFRGFRAGQSLSPFRSSLPLVPVRIAMMERDADIGVHFVKLQGSKPSSATGATPDHCFSSSVARHQHSDEPLHPHPCCTEKLNIVKLDIKILNYLVDMILTIFRYRRSEDSFFELPALWPFNFYSGVEEWSLASF
jgi:hypothetical protein